jgi:L-alanine-DL-glutamate epimerase-like enolase superfamily enzyme
MKIDAVDFYIALWDLLGRQRGEPVYQLLGDDRSMPKLPYASQLFGDTPQETLKKAQDVRAQGYRAAKVRLGAVWPRHARRRCRAGSCCARGSRRRGCVAD